MIVVDASVWVGEFQGALPQTMSDAIDTRGTVSPPHVDFEVGSALLRIERRGELPAGDAARIIEAFSRTPIRRIYDPRDAVHAVQLMNNSSYADAWYIALALRLGYPLATLDRGMAEVASIHNVEVIGPR